MVSIMVSKQRPGELNEIFYTPQRKLLAKGNFSLTIDVYTFALQFILA